MDIYSFINSKDIRNYLKEINYEFTPVEAAWLVWQCGNITLREKHNAWNEIINTMPDMPIADRRNNFPSLHGFLKDYMQLQKKIINDFYNPNDDLVIYQYTRLGTYYGTKDKYESNDVFSDFVSCFKDALSDLSELDKPAIQIFMKSNSNQIKIMFSANSSVINQNDLIDIIYSGNLSDEESDIECSFLNMWFAFPTPFRKGDIVIHTESYTQFNNRYNEPYVFVSSAYDLYKETGRRLYDYTDMFASVYMQYDDGMLGGESIINYMDLEYYTGKLSEEQRILKALSNYLKGKIDVVLFANAYHQILTEKYLSNVKITDWDEKHLILAGLKER